MFNLVMSEAIFLFIIIINNNSSLVALNGVWLFRGLPQFSPVFSFRYAVPNTAFGQLVCHTNQPS
jgi:hypothetical protein